MLSKLLERVVSLQLTARLEASDALPVNQSANRKYKFGRKRSTQSLPGLVFSTRERTHRPRGTLKSKCAIDTADYDIML